MLLLEINEVKFWTFWFLGYFHTLIRQISHYIQIFGTEEDLVCVKIQIQIPSAIKLRVQKISGKTLS